MSLGFFCMASLVVGDAALEGEAEVGFDEIGSGAGAAEANLLLGCGYEEDLVAVREFCHAVHGL